MKITKFDQTNLTKIANEVNDAVRDVAAKYGIQIKAVGGGTFNANEYVMKLKMNVLDESGTKKIDPMVERFGKLDFGQDFDITKTYSMPRIGDVKFVDFRTRARTQPWVIQSVRDGKQYIVTVQQAQMIAVNPAV